MERCDLCLKDSFKIMELKLCYYHSLAYDNLFKNYERWREAYGELEWRDYLKKILENDNTGVWVKELAKALLEREVHGISR
ncbi:MAG: hypothetical protein QXX95_06055 [Nitrososphaerales archaeon]